MTRATRTEALFKDHFVSHPLFLNIVGYLTIQPAGNPRYRIELSNKTPQDLVARALLLVLPCSQCGRKMQPFRTRSGTGERSGNAQHIYFNACCPLKPPDELKMKWELALLTETSSAPALREALKEAITYPRFCNRGNAASNVYDEVVLAVRIYQQGKSEVEDQP
jgi:hypothetical protein